ncbi:uncharacterized protein J3D65DRAFT_312231 [Phyllosticta citribraziliensis]|uniref:C2H2-type domain-containing protein n=1 Tax=Phyllosticta citribraziliensis TaxID=989973 RepID=A0ABR1LTM3_9PEZI
MDHVPLIDVPWEKEMVLVASVNCCPRYMDLSIRKYLAAGGSSSHLSSYHTNHTKAVLDATNASTDSAAPRNATNSHSSTQTYLSFQELGPQLSPPPCLGQQKTTAIGRNPRRGEPHSNPPSHRTALARSVDCRSIVRSFEIATTPATTSRRALLRPSFLACILRLPVAILCKRNDCPSHFANEIRHDSELHSASGPGHGGSKRGRPPRNRSKSKSMTSPPPPPPLLL